MNGSTIGAACKHPKTVEAIKKHLMSGRHEATSSLYPESVNLPFNRQLLPDDFTFHPTPGDSVLDACWWVLLQGNSVLLQPGDNGLLKLPYGHLSEFLPEDHPSISFASWQGHPVRALNLAVSDQLPAGLIAAPFNAFQEQIPLDLMTIAGMGKQLVHWQKLSSVCSSCGTQLLQLTESWGKSCGGCGLEHYPQIHPCAIVLIRRDDQILMVRKPEWPTGRYSLVAGFLDIGESLEECAIREAREETGVTIKNIRYVASQAWPFPSQLMVGFVADYSHGEIKVDGKEIDDARWFTLGSLPALPASRSIARFMIDRASELL